MNVRILFSLIFIICIFLFFIILYPVFSVNCLRFNEFPLLGIGLNVKTPFLKRGSM